MGEAVYYMKARFESEEAAEKALPVVTGFLRRMAECEDEFQSSRDGDKEAYEALAAKYSDVFEGLGIKPPADGNYHSLNCLAGQLNSPFGAGEEDIWLGGAELLFSGMVWHFADWTPLENYLLSIGAVKAAWLSDEDANLFDAIRLD